jgi:O2-independent ubiquinone biosynthesis accessory factor UbiT
MQGEEEQFMNLPRVVRLLARPMPVAAIQLVAQASLDGVVARHPQLFDRLSEYENRRFAIIATDLGLCFIIVPHSRRLSVQRDTSAPKADVRIAGSLLTLLSLAEGRLDGDAEFFARGLNIEGDMEAALALRNAMEDCRLDLPTDLASMAGPLRRPVEWGLSRIRSHLLSRGGARWN